MKKTMTLGEFYREYAPPCAMETFRRITRAEGVLPVAGSLPYEYPVKELLRVKEQVEQRKRLFRYNG